MSRGESEAQPRQAASGMRGWISFWNRENSIYVSARHRDVHFRTIAADLRAYVPGPNAVVLDYGCGEALHADSVADATGLLILSDAAPAVRERLRQRFAHHAKIEVRAPEQVEALEDGGLDLVILNSVAQYLTTEELDRLLALFRRLLKSGGLLVLGDVVPPAHSTLAAIAALIRFAARNGFLLAALTGLVRTAFSDYRKLRTKVGLTVYEEAAMAEKLNAAGFTARRARTNIGHNPARMTFIAERR